MIGEGEKRAATCALIVLTRDEEANLRHCLESVRGLVDEMFVVDSGSTDGTVEIARQFGAHVVEHEFTTQAEQFNWALDTLPLRSDWILRLDADEYLLPETREELCRLLSSLPTHVTGLAMKRRVYFLGRWIRHGGYYPTWLLRVIRRGAGRSESIEMDEHLIVLYGETQRLTHDFVDDNRKGLYFWIRKHLGYAEREARATGSREGAGGIGAGSLEGQAARRRWLKGNVYGRTPLFLRALTYFIYRYVIRAGFRDGVQGLIFHALQACWYRFYVDALLWETRHGREELM